MNDSVIAGALFDFMGWLTSRPKHIMLSSVDDATPAVNAIRDFAKMRGLSLDDAKVQEWTTAIPPQPQRKPEQEPVAFCDPTDPCNETAFSWPGTARKHGHTTPLHTSTPQRKPLGEHEIAKILDRERMKWHKSPPTYEFDLAFARAIEAAHGIKE